ncbi:flagellar biosynthesis protein FlgE [Sphingorhabdus sp. M41]|nr:flagellar biosynthesis protein FlgE [Sphingorhabdus sp. M41]
MATVADNITNINTVGYKGTEADFRTLVTDGRLKSSYSAGGVAMSPRATISKQGLLQAASASTDLGIEGKGFFVTRTGPEADSGVAFTRAGAFRPDDEGYLRNTSGYYLQGWRLDAQGDYVNNGSLNDLQPIRVSELAGTAAASTRIAMRANLQSTQTVMTGYVAGTMANGTTTPQFSRAVEVFDAQGGSHTVTLGFVKTGPNVWQGEIYADPGEVTAPGGLLASGTIQFNPDGSLDLASSSPALFDTLNITYTNGAAALPINLQLGSQDGLDGLTQFGGPSAVIASATDGGMLGEISSVEISRDGLVSAIFADGTARAVFQLPLAGFPNPDGLTRLPGNAYSVSQDSGTVAINAPGSLSGGTISAGTLEASNVDLATEFTNMIRFQRAYSASSKIITTVDDMLQEVSALKR